MNENRFANIRIVLVETSHPGNIGAAARAMKTMGLSRLSLVTPKDFPSAEATSRASGADDILAAAQIYSSLPEALQGCGMVIATTARMRTLSWPIMEPREMAQKIAIAVEQNEVAIVFGRERTGLSNEELAYCQSAVMIPTIEEYSSLNLASAVQILSYEIRRALLDLNGKSLSSESDKSSEPLLTSDQMESFYKHLEQTMIEVDYYDPKKPKHLLQRLRRLFSRAKMDESEVKMLRGFFAASQKIAKK